MSVPCLDSLSLPPGYRPKRFIASGSYGSVYLIEREAAPESSYAAAGAGEEGGEDEQHGPVEFAVKVIADYRRESMIASPDYKRKYLKRMAREINLVRHFQGCYEFVGYEAMYRSPLDNNLYIIMPYTTHNLREVTLETRLEEPVARFLTAQILSGLHKMHSKRCAHRDLSSRNVLVDLQHAFAYICDFGLSRAHINSDDKLTVEVVTLPYRAPELLMQCPNYDLTKVDIWSVGILLIEMVARSPPVAMKDVPRQLVGLFSDLIPYDASYWRPPRVSDSVHRFLRDNRERLEARSSLPKLLDVMPQGPNPLSPAGMDVLRCMLDPRPEARSSCYDLLHMEWFRSDEACWQQIQVMLDTEGTPDEDIRPDLDGLADSLEDAEAIAQYISYIEGSVPVLNEAIRVNVPSQTH